MTIKKLESWFERMPVVAILRGVQAGEVVEIGEALYSAGIGVMEVPLNSPDPSFSPLHRNATIDISTLAWLLCYIACVAPETLTRHGSETV